MAQDFTAKKLDFARHISDISRDILLISQKIDELSLYYSNNGFDSGGAHPIIDADLTGDLNYLTAANIAGVISAMATIQTALTAGVKTNLRQALKTEIF